MRIILLCFVLLIVSQVMWSQSYFSNVTSSKDTSRAGVFLETDGNSDIYVKIFTRCEPNAQACGHILKLTKSGNQIWRLKQPDYFVTNDNNFSIRDNKIYDSSYFNYLSNSLTYDRSVVDLQGQIISESSDTIMENLNNLWNYGSILLQNNTFLQYGVGDNEDTEYKIFNWSDSLGNHIKTELVESTHQFENIWDFRELPDGSLIYLSEHVPQGESLSDRVYSIERLWPDGELSTLYSTGLLEGHSSFTLELIYWEDRIVFTTPWQGGKTSIVEYQCIDTLGNLLWTQDIENPLWPNFHNTAELSVCTNGDLLVTGQYKDRSKDPQRDSGIITRMSKDGEILWNRVYEMPDTLTGDYKKGFIQDVEEDAEGNLVAVGNVQTTYVLGEPPVQDTWIMRLDADGCIGEEGCGVLITDVEEVNIVPTESLVAYPTISKVGGSIYVDHTLSRDLTYHINNIHGEVFKTETLYQTDPYINMDLKSGIYFISFPEVKYTQKIMLVD